MDRIFKCFVLLCVITTVTADVFDYDAIDIGRNYATLAHYLRQAENVTSDMTGYYNMTNYDMTNYNMTNLNQTAAETGAETLHLPANASSIRPNIVDTFSCENHTYGYYADVDNGCQVFHVCVPSQNPSGRNITYRYSFICPNETIFNQAVLVCTRPIDSIECEDSPYYYGVNMEIGKMNSTNNSTGHGDNNYNNNPASGDNNNNYNQGNNNFNPGNNNPDGNYNQASNPGSNYNQGTNPTNNNNNQGNNNPGDNYNQANNPGTNFNQGTNPTNNSYNQGNNNPSDNYNQANNQGSNYNQGTYPTNNYYNQGNNHPGDNYNQINNPGSNINQGTNPANNYYNPNPPSSYGENYYNGIQKQNQRRKPIKKPKVVEFKPQEANVETIQMVNENKEKVLAIEMNDKVPMLFDIKEEIVKDGNSEIMDESAALEKRVRRQGRKLDKSLLRFHAHM